MNIILANATIKNGNRGCTALAITMLFIFKKILDGSSVEYKIYLTDSYQPNGEYCENIGDEKIVYHTCGYPLHSSTFLGKCKLLLRNLFKKDDNLMIFEKADYIFDIGQGDSFSDIYGNERFYITDRIHKYARKLNIPYCILPQTIGPFDKEINRKKAIQSISKSTLCMVRDKQSLEFVLKNVQKQVNIKEYIDVAFCLPFKKIHQNDEFTHIGLNISALLWNGGYTRNNQFGLVCDYQKSCKDIIEYFLNQPKTKVHLISHVVLQERDVENDYEVSYELWREYNNPNLILAPFALGPIEIKSYIAGMDFFLGARMHATIAAFSSKVPVVPMAYSRKFNGLFVETLSYPQIVDLKEMSNEVILERISKFYSKKEEIKEIIEDRMNGVVNKRISMLLADLKGFMGI